MGEEHLKKEYLEMVKIVKAIYPDDKEMQKEFLIGFKKAQLRSHGRCYQEFEDIEI